MTGDNLTGLAQVEVWEPQPSARFLHAMPFTPACEHYLRERVEAALAREGSAHDGSRVKRMDTASRHTEGWEESVDRARPPRHAGQRASVQRGRAHPGHGAAPGAAARRNPRRGGRRGQAPEPARGPDPSSQRSTVLLGLVRLHLMARPTKATTTGCCASTASSRAAWAFSQVPAGDPPRPVVALGRSRDVRGCGTCHR